MHTNICYVHVLCQLQPKHILFCPPLWCSHTKMELVVSCRRTRLCSLYRFGEEKGAERTEKWGIGSIACTFATEIPLSSLLLAPCSTWPGMPPNFLLPTSATTYWHHQWNLWSCWCMHCTSEKSHSRCSTCETITNNEKTHQRNYQTQKLFSFFPVIQP